ncbi:MAG: hypothetical protein MRY64_04515 [Hyphomonadaceae bacterium]|nr:hypothetical protein [Hyphomonadaceae bacterium]
MRSKSPAILPTGLLLVALLLAFGLTGWRATLFFSPASAYTQPAGASLLEQRLTGLVTTLLGEGAAQVHQSIRPDGSRALLVLVDDSPAAQRVSDAALGELVSDAIFVDTIAGDTVTVRRIAFAKAPAGALSAVEIMELAGLVGLCIVLTGVLVVTRPGSALVQHGRAAAPSTPRSSAVEAPAAGLNTQLAAQRIGEDPTRAAHVIRGWLSQEVHEA